MMVEDKAERVKEKSLEVLLQLCRVECLAFGCSHARHQRGEFTARSHSWPVPACVAQARSNRRANHRSVGGVEG